MDSNNFHTSSFTWPRHYSTKRYCARFKIAIKPGVHFQWNNNGSVYIKRQHQCRVNDAMTLVILFLMKSMELLQNGVALHFEVTPILFNESCVASVITELTALTITLTRSVNSSMSHRSDLRPSVSDCIDLVLWLQDDIGKQLILELFAY